VNSRKNSIHLAESQRASFTIFPERAIFRPFGKYFRRVKITYRQFEKAMKPYGCFSLQQARRLFPGFDRKRLTEWQQKNYISKVIRGYYIFGDEKLSEPFLTQVAETVYKPSYISLERALWKYGFIPEAVFSYTLVTTRKTFRIDFRNHRFIYRNIKPSLFFGYRIENENHYRCLTAEPEKALLDFIYLNAKYDTRREFESLRLNYWQMRKELDFKKMDTYATQFHSKALNERYGLLKNLVHA